MEQRRPTVMVVDDEPEVLETLSALIERAGYQVVSHARFEDAKEHLHRTPPDILVTDVRLGKYNGLQLVLEMRTISPDAPIVVLSAFDDAMLRQDAARNGATYLTKPIRGSALIDALGGPWTGTGPA